MAHQFTNDLIHESSPYLLQHAHNPVNWMPWSEKALTLAQEMDKPILVSIGYAACHWCHVMERESFEDENIAKFMNENFVNIKIDREERPDLDHIYMEAVQVISGSGGWPLNVFLNSTGKPFYGGTYFPPIKAYNRSSWIEVLNFIHNLWNDNRSLVENQVNQLMNHLNELSIPYKSSFVLNEPSEIFTKESCINIKEKLMKNADIENGGFGRAPKFPQTFSIAYLLGFGYFLKDEAATNHALKSLETMLNGGIYDHLNGGLARYSTDDKWLAPHFEKMLYDNALLIDVLCDTYKITKEKKYQIAIEKTIDFCLNELSDENGGFYAAIDADSEGEEGKFYVWSQSEIETILGNDAALICKYYGVLKEGNWEGKNILHISKSSEIFAEENGLTVEIWNEILEKSNSKLLIERNKRIHPAIDDKIILSWNALMLKAITKASATLKHEGYKKIAINLFDFLKNTFSQNGIICHHTYKNEIAKFPAFLDDYAYFISACIQLQELTGNEKYIIEAETNTSLVLDNFKSDDGFLFYYTSVVQTDVVLRKLEVFDGALPSGNSVMAENLYYLSMLLDKKDWKSISLNMLAGVFNQVKKFPQSFSCWSSSMLWRSIGEKEVAITGTNIEKCVDEELSKYEPNRILQSGVVEKNYPLLKNKDYSNAALIYVCKDYSCALPEVYFEK
jgi:uncharacterized protein YyaL (SSP411 family)